MKTSVTTRQNKHLIFTSQLSQLFCYSYAKGTNICSYFFGLNSAFNDDVCLLSLSLDQPLS